MGIKSDLLWLFGDRLLPFLALFGFCLVKCVYEFQLSRFFKNSIELTGFAVAVWWVYELTKHTHERILPYTFLKALNIPTIPFNNENKPTLLAFGKQSIDERINEDNKFSNS